MERSIDWTNVDFDHRDFREKSDPLDPDVFSSRFQRLFSAALQQKSAIEQPRWSVSSNVPAMHQQDELELTGLSLKDVSINEALQHANRAVTFEEDGYAWQLAGTEDNGADAVVWPDEGQEDREFAMIAHRLPRWLLRVVAGCDPVSAGRHVRRRMRSEGTAGYGRPLRHWERKKS